MVKRRETKTGNPILVIDSWERVSPDRIESIRIHQPKTHLQRVQDMSQRQVEQLEKRILHQCESAQERELYEDFCKITGRRHVEEVEE